MTEGCGKKITRMNCPNWVCGEDNQFCKECGGYNDIKDASSREGEQ